jgi:hypothetical protein
VKSYLLSISLSTIGTMAELHEAQKLLGKAMNTDIESDYDPEQENKMKTKTTTIVKLHSSRNIDFILHRSVISAIFFFYLYF